MEYLFISCALNKNIVIFTNQTYHSDNQVCLPLLKVHQGIKCRIYEIYNSISKPLSENIEVVAKT